MTSHPLPTEAWKSGVATRDGSKGERPAIPSTEYWTDPWLEAKARDRHFAFQICIHLLS